MLFQLPSVDKVSLIIKQIPHEMSAQFEREKESERRNETWVPGDTRSQRTKVYIIPSNFVSLLCITASWCVSGHDFHAQHFFTWFMMFDWKMSKAESFRLFEGEKLISHSELRKWEYTNEEHYAMKPVALSHLWNIEGIFSLFCWWIVNA